MVLDEPLDVDEDLIPSFKSEDHQNANSIIQRSNKTISIITEYEKTVVPQMINMDWMSETAKSRSKPYYNDTEQNLNAHILPGVEILADIVERAPTYSPESLRDLISLWTIHDIHKIIQSSEDEFSIQMTETQQIVNKLNLDQFNENIKIEDYHSCAVALHNSSNSKIDDSTIRFTQLRPALRLVDAISSISDPLDFVDQTEKEVMNVFSTEETKYVPGCHKIEFNDSMTKMVINKTIYEILKDYDYIPLDIRENGVLYARPDNSPTIYEGSEDIVEEICSKALRNFRSGYQSFSNRSLLGSNIENPQSRMNYNKPPRVYDISSLSKVCLQKEELIQRIVQAAVKQQNIPYKIPKESNTQIENINDNLKTDIQKNNFVEGMAVLVHTVYKDIVPKLVDKNSDNWFERTTEGSLLYIFDCSEDVQKQLIEAMEVDDINASPMEWPYKYIIAQELHDKYTVECSRKERQNKLTKLILERISEFKNWQSFTDKDIRDFKDELYIRAGSKCYINNKKLSECQNVNLISRINNQDKTGDCKICNTATSQSAISPLLLSHNDFDILEKHFVIEKDEKLQNIDLSDTIPKEPICLPCQVALTVRAQQFSSLDDENKNIHISTHPVNSGSSASLIRFNKIVKILQRRIFTEQSTLDYYELGSKYSDIIEQYLEQTQNIESITDRERILEIASRRDAATSIFELPDDSRESRIKSICCITIAALISGLKVCITTKPQMNINYSQTKDIVSFGPDIREFKDLINTRADIIDFPRKVKILDRIIKIGEIINSTHYCIERYSNFNDKSVLPGSRIYNNINHMLKDDMSEDIIKNCVNIDSIASETDVFARELLKITSDLGIKLSNHLELNNSKDIENLVDNLLSQLLKDNPETEREFSTIIHRTVVNTDNISEDLISDYKTKREISEIMSDLYSKYNNQDRFGDLYDPIKNSIIIQAILESKRMGDKNVGT